MVATLLHLLRLLPFLCGGHRQLALENLALRHQLAVYKRIGRLQDAAVSLLTGKAVVFLVVAIVLGVRLAPLLIRWIGRMQARGTLIVYSLVFAVALAVIADMIGLATIIGAFAAGLILGTTERRQHVEHRINPIADLLVPVFFVTVVPRASVSP